MFCEDIYYLIGSYLQHLNDLIALHNVNRITRRCRYNVTLQRSCILPEFVYNEFNIVRICSTFTDYSNVDKLLTDKLIHMSVSHRSKDDEHILTKMPELINLQSIRMFSRKFTDDIFINLTQLMSLDFGYYQSDNFDGHCLSHLQNLKFLNLGDNHIDCKYVNTLTKLEYLQINTKINDNDFSLLTNLKRLDVSRSDYTLTDSNIATLINLRLLKCRYSTISSVDHLINLESLNLGINFVIKQIKKLTNLTILSLIYTRVNYIDLPNLLELTLNNDIEDEVLCIHTKLIYLYLGDNTFVTDNGIKTLTNLRCIHCNINRNITSNGLCNATNLEYIYAGMSYIKLHELTHLINLRYVEQYDLYLGNLESLILLDNRHI